MSQEGQAKSKRLSADTSPHPDILHACRLHWWTMPTSGPLAIRSAILFAGSAIAGLAYDSLRQCVMASSRGTLVQPC